jgi:hypothetical protein
MGKGLSSFLALLPVQTVHRTYLLTYGPLFPKLTTSPIHNLNKETNTAGIQKPLDTERTTEQTKKVDKIPNPPLPLVFLFRAISIFTEKCLPC